MRTDYTEEQVKEMGKRVPIRTRCYFSDYYEDGTDTCLINYVLTKRKVRTSQLEKVHSDSFLVNECYWNFIFPVDGFEALGIYPADELPSFKFGDLVETSPNGISWVPQYYIGGDDKTIIVANEPNFSEIKFNKPFFVQSVQFCRRPEKKKHTLAEITKILGYDFELVEE